jgi:hypothetical protein
MSISRMGVLRMNIVSIRPLICKSLSLSKAIA